MFDLPVTAFLSINGLTMNMSKEVKGISFNVTGAMICGRTSDSGIHSYFRCTCKGTY